MNTKLYHDARKANGRPVPVKFAINRKGSTAYIPLGVKVTAEQWDKRVERVINHPNADAMNISLYVSKVEYEKKLLALEMSGKLVGLSALEARDLLTKKKLGRTFKNLPNHISANFLLLQNIFHKTMDELVRASTLVAAQNSHTREFFVSALLQR